MSDWDPDDLGPSSREKHVTAQFIRASLQDGTRTIRPITVSALNELAQISSIEQLKNSPNAHYPGKP